jgi:hypothetical protein
MSHGSTNYNKIIANNLLAQQYTTKFMLGICNVFLKSESFFFFFFFLFFCFIWDVIGQISNFFRFYGLIYNFFFFGGKTRLNIHFLDQNFICIYIYIYIF